MEAWDKLLIHRRSDTLISQTTSTDGIITVTTSSGVTITVDPGAAPTRAVSAALTAAIEYSNAVNTGELRAQTNRDSINISFSNLDGANGAYSPNGNITIDWTPGLFGDMLTSDLSFTQTTIHELTHSYNPTLHLTEAGSEISAREHSEEFYIQVGLCCTNRVEDVLPLTPDGFSLQPLFGVCQVQ